MKLRTEVRPIKQTTLIKTTALEGMLTMLFNQLSRIYKNALCSRCGSTSDPPHAIPHGANVGALQSVIMTPTHRAK